MKKFLDKESPFVVAFIEIFCALFYIGILASVVGFLSNNVLPPPPPYVGIMIFLTTFVTSALIEGLIVLGYPLTLFFDGNKKRAIKIILFCILWLAIILGTIGIYYLTFWFLSIHK